MFRTSTIVIGFLMALFIAGCQLGSPTPFMQPTITPEPPGTPVSIDLPPGSRIEVKGTFTKSVIPAGTVPGVTEDSTFIDITMVVLINGEPKSYPVQLFYDISASFTVRPDMFIVDGKPATFSLSVPYPRFDRNMKIVPLGQTGVTFILPDQVGVSQPYSITFNVDSLSNPMLDITPTP